MNSPTTLRHGLRRRPTPYICLFCRQKRPISTSFLKKQDEAKEQWAGWAAEIKSKKRKSMLSILEERGFVHAIAGERDAVDKLMTNKRIGVYCGVDPTAPSLHVGHMLPFMALFWMHVHGFRTISLIGGATSAIGDPTGRTTDRPVMTPTERKANITAIHFQLKRLWKNLEQTANRHGYPYEKYWKRGIENNSVWWNNVTFVEVLKLLGTGLRLGPMLTRDTVKTKMESGDGMSFAEFCYPIMQAWDWWRMYQSMGVQMQIGGSDQFGNIVAGIEAVKYIARNHPDPDVRQKDDKTDLNTPYGFTVPLLTTASGAKFGKSAGNAIWLDPDMTSLFDLYGFFIRTADADVERYLKLFTFLPLNEIQSLMAQHKNDPSKRIPQHKLAYEFVSLVHGAQAASDASDQHKNVFAKPTLSSLTSSPSNPLTTNQNPKTREQGTFTSSQLNKFAPQTNAQTTQSYHIVLPKSLIYDQPIARVLYAAGLVTSRSEGHRLAENGGAYIGRRSSNKEEMGDNVSFVPAKLRDPLQTWANVIRDSGDANVSREKGEEGLLILRVGKWKVRIVRIVSDEVYEGMDVKEHPAGWLEMKAQLAAARQKKLFGEEEKGRSAEAARKEVEQSPGAIDDDDGFGYGSDMAPAFKMEEDVEKDDFKLHELDDTKSKRQQNLEGFKESQRLGEQHMREEHAKAGATPARTRWQGRGRQ